MTKLKYTFKSDIIFKMLFVKYPKLLKKLVAVLLKINVESIEQFEIRNPEMPPESLGDKFCRLDINMTVNGELVDLEIQVEDEGNYPERTLLYWARDYSNALPSGNDYDQLLKVVSISIIGYKLFDCKEFHSEFRPLEVKRHELLTDKMSIHYFELTKLPDYVDANNELQMWLALFKANTEEELVKIENMEVPIMNQTIDAYRRLTVSPEFYEAQRLYYKARHDEAQALRNAELKGMRKGKLEGMREGELKMRRTKLNIAKHLIQINIPTDKIIEATNLTYEEIKTLSDESKFEM